MENNDLWSVENLEEFLYFCCPECDVKNQSKYNFIQHALENHPHAIRSLKKFDLKKEEESDYVDEKVNKELIDINKSCNTTFEDFTSEFVLAEFDGVNFDENYADIADEDIKIKEANGNDTKEKQLNFDSDGKINNKRKKKSSSRKNSTANDNIIKKEIETNISAGDHINICKICNKVFANQNYIKLHIASVHEGQKNHNCEFCGKFYSNPQILKSHIRTIHDGLKDFKCKYCNKFFGLRGNLLKHISSVHEGLKHYCDTCGKSYARPDDLKKHIKTVHEGEKNYKCDSCGKSFGHSSVLRRHHRSIHEGKKNYKCILCKKSFSQSHHLKKHINNVHESVKS